MKDARGNTLNIDEARRLILALLAPVSGWEQVPIRAARNRVLLEDEVAPFDVPPHDNSAVDGYAFRQEDVGGTEETLRIVGTSLAGRPFSGVVGAGQAVRIMTGAVLPRGADTVAMQEDARPRDGQSVIVPALARGANVRMAGEDLAKGRPALMAGRRLGPAEIGLLASLGIAEVRVRRRLRVALFSTGDEVTSFGRPLGPGEIYDANRFSLFGLLSDLGVELIDMGVVRDDAAVIEQAFRDASREADVIITSGGVSVGEADFIKAVMAKLGQIEFWKLNSKPGRPLAFGRIGEAWLFGLPGNPVSVMVTFLEIVADALRLLAGESPVPERPAFRVRSASVFRKRPGRREFLRGTLFQKEGEWHVSVPAEQGSGILRSMVESNCLVVLPEESAGMAEGDYVEVHPYRGLF
jgi:molybdopterin molybdotransferase